MRLRSHTGMRRQANLKRLPKTRCSVCGARAVLRPASYVYGDQGKNMGFKLYVCRNYPKCNTYVSARAGKPGVRLADKKLRRLRIEAHRLQDLLIAQGVMSKANIYFWMRYKYKLTATQAHISLFDETMCERLIADYRRKLEKQGVDWQKEMNNGENV